MKGLAEDGGLFVPQELFKFNQTEINSLKDLNYQDLATEIIFKFTGNFIDKNQLSKLIQKSYSTFRHKNIIDFSDVGEFKIMELFHGPTLAFKDVGARFMARFLGYINEKKRNKKITVLVATSGDTGGAVASGFNNIEGIDVVILYPKNKVSKIQEKQLTTLGNNIYALEVDGSFDQCQALVKKAFLDLSLKKKINLSSANSINIARLIPQTFYYFNAYSKIKDKSNVVISVPSGNFGNVTAGLLSKKMGLPIEKFIASTNSNKSVPDFIINGVYEPYETIQTISNAMDVGNPSNIKRILDIYKKSDNLKKDMLSWSYDDAQTINAIRRILKNNKYILDPHSAVGLLGLENYIKYNSNCNGVFLGTAHPSKFLDIIETQINEKIKIPNRLKDVLKKEKKSLFIKNDYQDFSNYLLENFI